MALLPTFHSLSSLFLPGLLKGHNLWPAAHMAKTTGDIRQTLRYALAMLTVLSVVLYGIIFSFAGPLADLFNSEQNSQLHQIAVSGLRYYFTATFLLGSISFC